MGRERVPDPSPDGAARQGAAPEGRETARSVGIPPSRPAALSSPERFVVQWRLRWACRRLDRLARELSRQGWATEQRYGQSPPVLHVFPKDAPLVGDSVLVVRGPVWWWYRSSTGAWLGPCAEPWRAAESVTALLAMWGVTPGAGHDW